ncbi:hypothetical protein PsorP6_003419 [Peronosclerospora sorghi]|uniref:Uncharacterized protein n=1 Tax=Peronosclerospora sorghi TaxID=230839 RepID=A0ACC0VRB6_9STRA|nr:hypothetical protein PsorP6_003419 [Peronosclerospora sorghi]
MQNLFPAAMDLAHNLLQYLIFALLVLSIVFILWKSATCYKLLRDIFCCRSCIHFCAWHVHYDEADLRTLRELEQSPHRDRVGINGAYRMYQARRSRLSLRLASWREDVERSGDKDGHVHHKLAQLRAAYNQCHQCLPVASPETDGRTSGHRVISTPSIPFDIRAVETTHGVDRLNSLSTVPVLLDLPEPEYKLVQSTPRHEPLARAGHRAIVIPDEEEEKRDVVPCDLIV